MAASLDTTPHPHLPLIIAGPILRKVTSAEVNLWLVTTKPLQGLIEVIDAHSDVAYYSEDLAQLTQLQVGEKAWVCLLSLKADFPTHQALRYQLHTQDGLLTDLLPHINYQQDDLAHKGIEFLISKEGRLRPSWLLS